MPPHPVFLSEAWNGRCMRHTQWTRQNQSEGAVQKVVLIWRGAAAPALIKSCSLLASIAVESRHRVLPECSGADTVAPLNEKTSLASGKAQSNHRD